MMERKFFPAEVKVYDDKTLTITHFVSTEDKDRSGDVMRADGMQLDGTPSVLKQHGFDPDTGAEPIAKCLDIRVATNEHGQKGIMVRTQYYDGSGLTPPDNTGRRLYEKAKGDFMPYWSVGYIVNKAIPARGGGREIVEWTMAEYSQVGVPDNVNAKAFDPEKDAHDFDLKFSVTEDKARGDGQGQGGEPQGDGGADLCVCPECGHEQKHKKGVPCTETKCSECGAAMTGTNTTKASGDMAENKKSFADMVPVAVPPEVATGISGCATLDIGEYKSLPIYGNGDQVFAFVSADEVDAVQQAMADSIVVGLKSVTARVAMRLPADAMSTVFYAFMDELWVNARAEKDARNAVRELAKLLEPYAVDFVSATLAMEAEEKSAKYAEYKASRTATADPAPVVETKSDPKPPEKKAVLSVVTKKAPPAVNIDVHQLGASIEQSVRSGLRVAMGKLD